MSLVLPSFQGFSHTPTSAGVVYAYNLDDSYGIDTVPSLHLDASILDGSDSANNPTDGTAVSTWGDRSGNNNDFTEATNQPTFKASWLNGKPAVEFDGADDVMSDSDFFSNVDFSGKNVTMIVVFQPQGDLSYSITETGSYGGDDRTGQSSSSYSSAFLGSRIGNVSATTLEKSTPIRSASTYGLRIDNTAVSYKIYYNNRVQYDHTSYSSSHFGTNSTGMKIGCGDSNYKLDGFISEVLVFNTNLSDSEFNTIHSYIDNKYNIHQYNNVTGSYALNDDHSTTVTPVIHLSAQSGLYKSDGSEPADTEQVYKWTDKARGYHAIAANAPVLNTNQVNTSLNGIYFDGTDDYMDVFMLSMLGDFSDFDGTAIFLFRPDSDTQYQPIGIGGSSNGRLYDGGSTYVDIFRQARLFNPSTSGFFTSTGVQLGSIVSDKTANTYKIFKDGGSDVFTSNQTASATAALFTDFRNMRLGTVTGATPSFYLKGWIYEVLVFDEPLSTSNLNAVGNYLSDVYGTTYTDIT